MMAWIPCPITTGRPTSPTGPILSLLRSSASSRCTKRLLHVSEDDLREAEARDQERRRTA